ncbi:MAG: nucleoside triphosphate pyrophosphohydrolase [Pseudomonadota bacterium]
MGKTEENSAKPGIERLVDIVSTLRSEQGCPWDRKQTPETMWKCLAEELYELLEAIEKDQPGDICEETGDVLFQLVFIAQIYSENGLFDIWDAIAVSAAKMIRRHPHVYQDQRAITEEELHRRWDSIKTQEKLESGKEKEGSVLDSVPMGMPPLLRSYKVSERAMRFGLDWGSMAEVMEKVEEEWVEFGKALASGNPDDIASEFGDILFTLSNVARFAGIHPETALARSTEKFERRFRFMERYLNKEGLSLKSLPRETVDHLWEDAKRAVKE